MKQGGEESLQDIMTRVQFLVLKSCPMLDMENREQISVPAFCKGLVAHDSTKLAALQKEGKVAKGMKIAASLPAFSATPDAWTSEARRNNEKRHRYLMNVAMEE